MMIFTHDKRTELDTDLRLPTQISNMKMKLLFYKIVAISSVLNYANNALIQFMLPVFTERALARGISEF